MIRNKTIKFNLDKPDERELWEWLQTLPHGYFSDVTKRHFKSLMKRHQAAPSGYGREEGKLIIEPSELQVVQLVHELRNQGVVEEDIKIILNEFEIPKRGQEWKRPLEEIRDDIFKRADEIIRERMEMKEEQK